MFSFYDLIALWNNFFFDPINMINLGLFRICIGLVCCYKIYALNYRLNEYLGVDGWYMLKLWKRASDSKHYFCIFNYLPSTNNSVLFVMSIFLISSICLTLGLCTALSSAIAYICWLSICHRNIFIFNSGDSLLRMLLFFLVFSYGGYYCSLDNYIYNRDQIQACLNPWVTRLMQISVLSMYLHTVYYKINYGADWCDGTAVHYACNNFSFNRLKLFQSLSMMQSKMITYGTLLIEIVFPLGLLFKQTASISALALIVFHGILELVLRIAIFSPIIMASLLLFIESEYLLKLIQTCNQLFAG